MSPKQRRKRLRKKREEPEQQPISPQTRPPRLNLRRVEEKALERFLRQNNLEQFPVSQNVRLTQIDVIDPISTFSPIRVLNILVAEVELNSTCILTGVREIETL